MTPDERMRALRALPGGSHLLDALAPAADVWLVGGAVRDLLLGRTPTEIDLVTLRAAEQVAAELGELVASHDRFGTARARWGPCAFDVARARTESYDFPGALPRVTPAGLDADLERRDFTVNAIAMALDGDLVARPGSLGDLEEGVMRVLHPASFADDPTRLWRLVRYSVRLGFGIEAATTRLAADAVASGALETVSGERLGSELRLALIEPDPLATLHAARNLGLISGLRLDPALTARALSLLPAGARSDLTILGAALETIEPVVGLGFTAEELEVLRCCAEAEPLEEDRPSRIAARLRGQPAEAVAVAGAAGSARVAERWFLDWSKVELEIGGDDLIAAGMAAGPEIGERLQRTLDRKLDGEIAGRDEELRTALSSAPWRKPSESS